MSWIWWTVLVAFVLGGASYVATVVYYDPASLDGTWWEDWE